MQNQFLKYIAEHNLCYSTDKILLGVSGGIDSVCMLHLFKNLNYDIAIAHCNFQLRGKESNADELFVQQLAEQLNVPFYVTRFNTEEIAKKNGISIQMAARDLRYEWFQELLQKYNFTNIAIAHNKDDVIETFFINLSRGSGIKGLTGIKPKYKEIIRPLLFASRKEITEYISTNNLEYREDSTNKSTKYSRNLIRHDIIPLFENLNPNFRETMIENIDRLIQTESIYKEALSKELEKIIAKQNNKQLINIEKLQDLSSIKAYIFEILHPYGFSNTQINDILESLHGISGKKFISQTHRLIKDREYLILEEINLSKKSIYYIPTPDEDLNYPLNIEIDYFPKPNNLKFDNNKEIALFDFNKVDFPLTLRKWKQGDYFYPLGMENIKKLSDFFIDNKFSLSEKEDTWLLESGNKIMWIIGSRIDNRFKVTERTSEVLRLKINNL